MHAEAALLLQQAFEVVQDLGANTLSGLVPILREEAQVDILLPLIFNTKDDHKAFARKVSPEAT